MSLNYGIISPRKPLKLGLQILEGCVIKDFGRRLSPRTPEEGPQGHASCMAIGDLAFCVSCNHMPCKKDMGYKDYISIPVIVKGVFEKNMDPEMMDLPMYTGVGPYHYEVEVVWTEALFNKYVRVD